jgi:dTDP-4-amino-4,6-dideoxygalactose transaminase
MPTYLPPQSIGILSAPAEVVRQESIQAKSQTPLLLKDQSDRAHDHIIPFNKPVMAGKEAVYMQQALASGRLSGDGPFTHQCHNLLKQVLNVRGALLTTSCTHALEMSAILLDIQPGDEVIVPSYTFVSTINAFVLRGAKPVFLDIRPDTLNLDESKLEQAITPRTKAIVPVHYAGVSCEMDEILAIANKYGIPVVEDNAHGLFGKYKGQYLGTMGVMATQSFHETKNFSCGEGGALLVNDPAYLERAEIIREKGTNRSRFFRGQVDKYSWVDLGSSYLPSDILAATLLAQLEAREQIQAQRQQVWEYYNTHLQDWAAANQVRLPVIPAHVEQAYHMFYMILPSLEKRQALIADLKQQGIHTAFHYLPLNQSDMGLQFGGKAGDCPVTEYVSDRLLRLPLYGSLTEADLARIVSAIEAFPIHQV